MDIGVFFLVPINETIMDLIKTITWTKIFWLTVRAHTSVVNFSRCGLLYTWKYISKASLSAWCNSAACCCYITSNKEIWHRLHSGALHGGSSEAGAGQL